MAVGYVDLVDKDHSPTISGMWKDANSMFSRTSSEGGSSGVFKPPPDGFPGGPVGKTLSLRASSVKTVVRWHTNSRWLCSSEESNAAKKITTRFRGGGSDLRSGMRAQRQYHRHDYERR